MALDFEMMKKQEIIVKRETANQETNPYKSNQFCK